MTSPATRSGPHRISDRYAIRRKLGSGSVGTVYLALDEATGRDVALKVIRSERLQEESAEKLEAEFRAIARLKHPQIAAAFDFGYVEGSGFPFYTREYIEGVPLPAGPPPAGPPGAFLEPLLDLLDALAYLHDHDILHLDIHAGNLILANDEERGSVLIDFGLVRSPAAETALSASTTAWTALPPEMVRGGKATARSDLFLAGRLLLYRLTGRAAGDARLPREIPGWGPRLTLELERIAAKALQPAPEARFRTAAEFRGALSGLLGGRGRRRRAREPEEGTVGREVELAEIESALRGLAEGKSALLWFVGKEGLGKTRLLSEARLRAQLRGLDVVEASFRARPAPDQGLLKTLRACRGQASWLEPLEAEHGGSPEERARRAAEVCFAEEGKPLVICLDDLDAADRESAILAEALVGECVRRRQLRGSQVRGKRTGGGGSGAGGGRALAIVAASSKPPPRGLLRGRDRRVLGPLRRADAERLARALLRPLAPGRGLLRAAATQSEGSPLRLRQIARALAEEWDESGVLPATAELPPLPPVLVAVDRAAWDRLGARERELLESLAIVGVPMTALELAAALGRERRRLGPALRRLTELEVVRAEGPGASRCYRLALAEETERIAGRVPDGRARAIRRRLVGFLQARRQPTPRDRENLARHLLALGRRREAFPAALAAARALAGGGSFDRAARLLEEAAAAEASADRRLALVEAMSSILERSGDHQKGIAVLEPLCSRPGSILPPAHAVRLYRRLAVHYHRGGRPDDALAAIARVERAADPSRDLEDLVFLDSELAELHIFRGSFAAAGEACRRGLARLRGLPARGGFRGRMEVVLRASLGHLELRRLRLEEARRELRAAWKLAERFGTTSEQASILGNLGIVENQRNDFAAARASFRRAERLFLRSGERRGAIKTASNVAVIAAKLGEEEEAHLQLERAARLLRRYPEKRMEFFLPYSRGIAACLLGQAGAAIEALEAALPLGRALGDEYLVGFGRIYLAESFLAAGRHAQALRELHAAAAQAERGGPPLLARMAYSRLFLAEVVLGRPRLARRAARRLEETRRTDVELLEAWNDLHRGVGLVLSGGTGGALFAAAGAVFARLEIPAGERGARLGLLLEALARRDEQGLRAGLGSEQPWSGGGEEARPAAGHAFLAVAEALTRAEASLVLGDATVAESWLARGSSAIVGQPFLELDWRLELLRGRLALRRGDLREARRHVHRSLHTRDLLLQLVPPAARARYLAHPRFAALAEAAGRLERSPRLHLSTEEIRRTRRYEGMVGQSSSMMRLFQTIERLRDQDLPILVLGETGTGKELVARAIHGRSARSRGPFLALHAASLPAALFESELFGYQAGAFSEAREDHAGILEELDGGTLLLDEAGDLPLECQAKLLRFLATGAFRRVGGTKERRADVRLIACARRDLREAVRHGSFREDLYYRLRGVEIEVPPLRSRREDIRHLARHFLELHAERLDRPVPVLKVEALALLEGQEWPGNVRELEGVLLRAVVGLSRAETIEAGDLEPYLAPRRERLFDPSLLQARSLPDLRRELEREYLVEAFLKARGDPRRLMERLGVKRTRLYTWLRRLGIDVRELRRRL